MATQELDLSEIEYESDDDLVQTFLHERNSCRSKKQLRKVCKKYYVLSPDLLTVRIRKLKQIRNVIPHTFIITHMAAEKFGVPWGCALLQIVAAGLVSTLDENSARAGVLRKKE